MGYVENCLPKALASLGHDVHVITTDAQVYFDSPDYAATYEPFIGPRVVPTGVKTLDGYTLRRLPHSRWRGRLRISGLYGELKAIRPDVVQALEVYNMSTLEVALAQPGLRYKLFLESHVHASVFGVDWRLASRKRRLRRAANRRHRRRFHQRPGREVLPDQRGRRRDRRRPVRHGPVEDRGVLVGCRHRAVQASGVARGDREPGASCALSSVFVTETSCAYTRAASRLRRALRCWPMPSPSWSPRETRSGACSSAAARRPRPADLRNSAGCQVVPFVPARDLPPYYWAADIGVWPKQELTSQLDAAAAGLPIILSDRITVLERVDGKRVDLPRGRSGGPCGAHQVPGAGSGSAAARHRRQRQDEGRLSAGVRLPRGGRPSTPRRSAPAPSRTRPARAEKATQEGR